MSRRKQANPKSFRVLGESLTEKLAILSAQLTNAAELNKDSKDPRIELLSSELMLNVNNEIKNELNQFLRLNSGSIENQEEDEDEEDDDEDHEEDEEGEEQEGKNDQEESKDGKKLDMEEIETNSNEVKQFKQEDRETTLTNKSPSEQSRTMSDLNINRNQSSESNENMNEHQLSNENLITNPPPPQPPTSSSSSPNLTKIDNNTQSSLSHQQQNESTNNDSKYLQSRAPNQFNNNDNNNTSVNKPINNQRNSRFNQYSTNNNNNNNLNLQQQQQRQTTSTSILINGKRYYPLIFTCENCGIRYSDQSTLMTHKQNYCTKRRQITSSRSSSSSSSSSTTSAASSSSTSTPSSPPSTNTSRSNSPIQSPSNFAIHQQQQQQQQYQLQKQHEQLQEQSRQSNSIKSINNNNNNNQIDLSKQQNTSINSNSNESNSNKRVSLNDCQSIPFKKLNTLTSSLSSVSSLNNDESNDDLNEKFLKNDNSSTNESRINGINEKSIESAGVNSSTVTSSFSCNNNNSTSASTSTNNDGSTIQLVKSIIYQCNSCLFQTDKKSIMNRHSRVHLPQKRKAMEESNNNSSNTGTLTTLTSPLLDAINKQPFNYDQTNNEVGLQEKLQIQNDEAVLKLMEKSDQIRSIKSSPLHSVASSLISSTVSTSLQKATQLDFNPTTSPSSTPTTTNLSNHQLMDKSKSYCKDCDIQFSSISTYQHHRNNYCQKYKTIESIVPLEIINNTNNNITNKVNFSQDNQTKSNKSISFQSTKSDQSAAIIQNQDMFLFNTKTQSLPFGSSLISNKKIISNDLLLPNQLKDKLSIENERSNTTMAPMSSKLQIDNNLPSSGHCEPNEFNEFNALNVNQSSKQVLSGMSSPFVNKSPNFLRQTSGGNSYIHSSNKDTLVSPMSISPKIPSPLPLPISAKQLQQTNPHLLQSPSSSSILHHNSMPISSSPSSPPNVPGAVRLGDLVYMPVYKVTNQNQKQKTTQQSQFQQILSPNLIYSSLTNEEQAQIQSNKVLSHLFQIACSSAPPPPLFHKQNSQTGFNIHHNKQTTPSMMNKTNFNLNDSSSCSSLSNRFEEENSNESNLLKPLDLTKTSCSAKLADSDDRHNQSRSSSPNMNSKSPDLFNEKETLNNSGCSNSSSSGSGGRDECSTNQIRHLSNSPLDLSLKTSSISENDLKTNKRIKSPNLKNETSSPTNSEINKKSTKNNSNLLKCDLCESNFLNLELLQTHKLYQCKATLSMNNALRLAQQNIKESTVGDILTNSRGQIEPIVMQQPYSLPLSSIQLKALANNNKNLIPNIDNPSNGNNQMEIDSPTLNESPLVYSASSSSSKLKNYYLDQATRINYDYAKYLVADGSKSSLSVVQNENLYKLPTHNSISPSIPIGLPPHYAHSSFMSNQIKIPINYGMPSIQGSLVPNVMPGIQHSSLNSQPLHVAAAAAAAAAAHFNSQFNQSIFSQRQIQQQQQQHQHQQLQHKIFECRNCQQMFFKLKQYKRHFCCITSPSNLNQSYQYDENNYKHKSNLVKKDLNNNSPIIDHSINDSSNNSSPSYDLLNKLIIKKEQKQSSSESIITTTNSNSNNIKESSNESNIIINSRRNSTSSNSSVSSLNTETSNNNNLNSKFNLLNNLNSKSMETTNQLNNDLDPDDNNNSIGNNSTKSKQIPVELIKKVSLNQTKIDESLIKHPLVRKTLSEAYGSIDLEISNDQTNSTKSNEICLNSSANNKNFFMCTTCGYRGNTCRGVKQHGKLHLSNREHFAIINITEREPLLIYNSQNDNELQIQFDNSSNNNQNQFKKSNLSLIVQRDLNNNNSNNSNSATITNSSNIPSHSPLKKIKLENEDYEDNNPNDELVEEKFELAQSSPNKDLENLLNKPGAIIGSLMKSVELLAQYKSANQTCNIPISLLTNNDSDKQIKNSGELSSLVGQPVTKKARLLDCHYQQQQQQQQMQIMLDENNKKNIDNLKQQQQQLENEKKNRDDLPTSSFAPSSSSTSSSSSSSSSFSSSSSSSQMPDKSQTYCFKCNIQFQQMSNFLAHKKLYCK